MKFCEILSSQNLNFVMEFCNFAKFSIQHFAKKVFQTLNLRLITIGIFVYGNEYRT